MNTLTQEESVQPPVILEILPIFYKICGGVFVGALLYAYSISYIKAGSPSLSPANFQRAIPAINREYIRAQTNQTEELLFLIKAGQECASNLLIFLTGVFLSDFVFRSTLPKRSTRIHTQR